WRGSAPPTLPIVSTMLSIDCFTPSRPCRTSGVGHVARSSAARPIRQTSSVRVAAPAPAPAPAPDPEAGVAAEPAPAPTPEAEPTGATGAEPEPGAFDGARGLSLQPTSKDTATISASFIPRRC